MRRPWCRAGRPPARPRADRLAGGQAGNRSGRTRAHRRGRTAALLIWESLRGQGIDERNPASWPPNAHIDSLQGEPSRRRHLARADQHRREAAAGADGELITVDLDVTLYHQAF